MSPVPPGASMRTSSATRSVSRGAETAKPGGSERTAAATSDVSVIHVARFTSSNTAYASAVTAPLPPSARGARNRGTEIGSPIRM